MNVLLVDDHPIVLEALASLLARRDPRSRIVPLSKIEDFSKTLTKGDAWDVVLVDLNFHGEMRGFDLITEIKNHSPELPVIVISMHAEDAVKTRAMNLGADAYVNKTDPPSEIFKAIDQFCEPPKGGDASGLSRREREIADCVISGQSSREIADRLSISVRTVETHRNRIMKKLGAKNTAHLVSLLKTAPLS